MIDYEKYKNRVSVMIYFGIIAIVVYLFFTKLLGFITPFLIAILFAIMINPIVNFTQKKLKFNRKLASAIVIVLVFLFLGGLIYVTFAEIYSFCKSFVTDVLGNTSSFNDKVSGLDLISKEIQRLFNLDIDLVETLKNLILPLAQSAVNIATSVASKVPQIFVATIVFILATFFMVSDKERILGVIKKVIKVEHLKWFDRIRKVSGTAISKYFKAQLIMLCITFSELIIAFTVIKLFSIADMKYIFLLSLGIAVLDALPVFGTGAVLIPWSIYSIIVGDFNFALALIIIYVVCLVVRQFVEPKVVGDSLGIHPLITLLAMYIGLQTIGIIGMILFPIIILFIIQLYKASKEGEKPKSQTHIN